MTPEEQLKTFLNNHTLRYVLEAVYDLVRDKEENTLNAYGRKSLERDADRIFELLDKIEN